MITPAQLHSSLGLNDNIVWCQSNKTQNIVKLHNVFSIICFIEAMKITNEMNFIGLSHDLMDSK